MMARQSTNVVHFSPRRVISTISDAWALPSVPAWATARAMTITASYDSAA
jgi:hypothetical protein